MDLVVMTQNVLGGGPAWASRKRALARRIRAITPDVVGLQEVRAPSVDAAMNAGLSQAHELAAIAGDYHVDFAPGRVWPDGSCEGVALLLRRHVLRERSVEALTLDRGDYLERDAQRVVLCAMLDVEGGARVDVFVTHLSLSQRARARTVKELMAFTSRERHRSHSDGAVLVGDLNARPAEECVLTLERHWIDVGASLGATWPAVLPFRRIDYLFAQPRDRWSVAACAREPASGSDHRGLVAHLRLVA